MNSSPTSIETEDHWKEQLRFVSSTVLVCGAGLLGMWHYVAMFKAGTRLSLLKWFERRANRSYVAVLIVWLFIGITLVLFLIMIPAFGVELWLRSTAAPNS